MARPHLTKVLVVALGALLGAKSGGCSETDGSEILASKLIGPEGGTISGGGVTLTIPAKALTAATEIEIRSSRQDLSARDFVQYGDALRLAPEGLALQQPAELSFDRGPADPAVLVVQDGLKVVHPGKAAWINELRDVAIASSGMVVLTAKEPTFAATPGSAADLYTDRVHLALAVAETPRLNLVLTAYDDQDVYDKPLNGTGQGDCALALENIIGGSLSLTCAGSPVTAQISVTSAEVSFDAVPFQAGKLDTPVTIGVVAGGEDLAYFLGFFRFDTGSCFGESCSGHGSCIPGDPPACQCDEGFAPAGLACECMPQCAGRECGGDSCGGQCPPGCGAGEDCNYGEGVCEPDGSDTSGTTGGDTGTGSTSTTTTGQSTTTSDGSSDTGTGDSDTGGSTT